GRSLSLAGFRSPAANAAPASATPAAEAPTEPAAASAFRTNVANAPTPLPAGAGIAAGPDGGAPAPAPCGSISDQSRAHENFGTVRWAPGSQPPCAFARSIGSTSS